MEEPIVEPKKRYSRRSTEYLSRLNAGRDAYNARRKAEKEARLAALGEGAPAELSPLLAGSDNGPALIQPKPVLGRPVGPTLSHRERTQVRVAKKLEKLLDAQIDAATGLHYVTKDGKHVYTKIPDTPTGQYLLNQLIGKPKESIEIKSTNLNLDI